MTPLFLGLSPGEILIVLLAVVLLFGAKKLPEIARGLGKGLQEFRKAADDIKKEIHDNSSDIVNDIKDIKDDINNNLKEESD